MKKKINDWLWWNIGEWFWKRSARQHPLKEVERRLGWMKLDCFENTSAGQRAVALANELRKDCMKVLECLYLEVDKRIADDVRNKVMAYVNKLAFDVVPNQTIMKPKVTPIISRCPHCGGQAVMECKEAETKFQKEKLFNAEIYCVNIVTCGASLDVFLHNEDMAKTQCIERWNRRCPEFVYLDG